MVLLVSKWNGRNYYWYDEWKWTPYEVIKMKGRYYKAKFILGEGLRAMWMPLKNFYFNND